MVDAMTDPRTPIYESGVVTVLDRIERGELTDVEQVRQALWRVVSRVRDVEAGIIRGENAARTLADVRRRLEAQ